MDSERGREVQSEPEPRLAGLIQTLEASGIEADAAGRWKTAEAKHAIDASEFRPGSHET